MTTPTVVSSSGYGVTSAINHTVTLPSSLVAGNLLLLICGAAANMNTPSGWTHLGNLNNPGAYATVFARISDGTETTVTITSGGTNAVAAQCYQIGDWYGSIADGVFLGTAATGQSSSANPPSLTHTLGSNETLWVACAALSLQNVTVNTWPSGYSNTRGSPGRCFTATKNSTSDTEDAGAFALNVSFGFWVAYTIGIVSNSARPVQSGGSSTVIITGSGSVPDVVVNNASQTVSDWPVAVYGEPVIVRPGTLIYLLSATYTPEWARPSDAGPTGDGYLAVYDGGVPLDREADYSDEAELLSEQAYPSPGCYRMYFADEVTYVRLGSTPVYELRASCVSSEATGLDWSASLLCAEAGVTGTFHGDLFVAARYVADGSTSYLDVLNDVASLGPYSFGFNRLDEFEVTQFAEPSGDPVLTFTTDGQHQWLKISRTTPQGSEVPVYRLTVNAGETWPCPTAGSATDELKAALARTPWYQTLIHEDATILDKHALALTQTVEARSREFDDTADYEAFRDRFMALFGVEREQLVLDVPMTAATLALDLNDVVEVRHSRMGLSGGRLYRIIAQSLDLKAGRASFTLWG